MKVPILVPRRAGEPYRDASWDFVRARWEHDAPDWPIVIGEHVDGHFNRSAAINAAARAAGDWDAALVVDSDSFLDFGQAVEAVNTAVRTGELVVAFTLHHALTKEGSAEVLAGDRGDWGRFVKRTVKDGCSSCIAVTRELWEATGGFDEGFDGWGWEDVAFSSAARALAGKGRADLRRVRGAVWHLWHPRSAARADKELLDANRARVGRYLEVRKHADAAAMAALLEDLGVR